MKFLIVISCLLHSALVTPQLISFKDGKVGVNILGYHAEAGLGGGHNGGGLLGGLHASAGTPWGQNAAAGLGGDVNGRAAGVLYAGAQATPDVGASAVLGGDTSQGGFSGSEAYANGKVTSRTRTIVAGNTYRPQEYGHTQLPQQPVTENNNVIQKIRPPKKYYASEMNDLVNSDANTYNFDNVTKTFSDTEQEKPATAVASIVITKIPPFHNAAPALTASMSVQSLKDDVNNPITPINPTPSASLPLSSVLSTTPHRVRTSMMSLSHSFNGDNLNENIAPSLNHNDDITSVIITREKTKLRRRQHQRQHHRAHPKRNNLRQQRQRQRSKTIVNFVEQKQQKSEQQQQQLQQKSHQFQQPAVPQPQHHGFTEELFPIKTPQQQFFSQIYEEQVVWLWTGRTGVVNKKNKTKIMKFT